MKAERLAALIVLLTLSVSVPTARAQSDVYGFSVDVEKGSIDVGRLKTALLPFTVNDFSRDQNQQAMSHSFNVRVQPLTNDTKGWGAVPTRSFFSTVPGQLVTSEILISTTGNPRPYFTKWSVLVRMSVFNGSYYDDSFEFEARLIPFYEPHLLIADAPVSIGPSGEVHYNVQVTNAGAYPDSFDLSVVPTLGWFAGIQPNIALEPGETEIVKLTLVAPSAKAFYQGETATFTLVAVSNTDPDFAYTTIAVASVAGFYVPPFWWPQIGLGAVLLSIVVSGTRMRARQRRLEDGPPRPVRLTPAQEEAMFRLRSTDPEAYRVRSAELRRIYEARRADYKAHIKERHQHFLVEKRHQRAEAARIRRERKAKARATSTQRQTAAREKARIRKEAARAAQDKRKQIQGIAKLQRKAQVEKQRVEKKAWKADRGKRKAEARAAKIAKKEEAKRRKQLAKLEKVKRKLVAKKTKELQRQKKAQLKALKQQAKMARKQK
ncbi:MAG: hypothetical protein HY556_09215 [Euryarchaeota archaeon]|nr:hypothetical protein [Euryarchaeota archaeon]